MLSISDSIIMLSDMKTNQSIQTLEARIAQVKRQLQAQGPMRPGSLSRQYNVCGKPGCRCKDPKHPRRHVPTTNSTTSIAEQRPPSSSAEKSSNRCRPNWPITKSSAD